MVLVVSGLASAGCGAAARPRVQAPEPIEMDVVRVTARPAPAGGDGREALEVDAYDARELLRRGNVALVAGSHDEAIELYDRLIGEFPDSSLISSAHFNAALIFDRRGELERAAARYLAAAQESTDPRDVKDSLFQAARCFERLERWSAAIEALDAALERRDLTPDEQLEAMARRGTALILAGEREEGEAQLRRAVLFYRRSGVEAIRTDHHLAQAQYYLGEAPRLEMAEVELTNDESQFRVALVRRCELLLRAQTQYVQAIRVGNAEWGAASAYRVGEMYSGLYNDVMAVPVPDVEIPPDLTTPEEIQAFRDEFPRHYRRLLREYLEPLLHNAIRWWESNLMMVERTGVHGEWVERTRENLAAVQRLLEAIELDVDSEDQPSPEGDPPAQGL